MSKDILLISCNETYSYNDKPLIGIEYAKVLRRNNETRPIVFTSFDTKDNILKRPHTNIITAIGHTFLQSPFTTSEWQEAILYFIDDDTEELEGLSDIQLKDIVLNFCGLRSSLSNTFHDFKGNLRNIKGSITSETEKTIAFENEINEFGNRVNTDYIEYPNLLNEINRILNLYEKGDITSIEKILAYTEDSLISYLPADESTKNESISTPKPWKVLFLDDKPNEISDILELLSPEKRNIGYAIVNTMAEAKKAIEDDLANHFAVVVSDYRLYKNYSTGKNEMQKKQGYDFLIWLAKQDRFNALVALSGLGKWFLMDSFRKRQINVKVYSKNNVLSGGANAFVDDLEYLGEKIYETILSIPKTTEWKRQMQHYYKWLRIESSEEDRIEQFIAAKAEEIISHLDNKLSGLKKIKKPEEKYKYLSLQDYEGNAQANLSEEFKQDEISLFKLKLVYRRVLIYYFIQGTIEPNIVAKILQLGSASAVVYEKNGAESDDQYYKKNKKHVFRLQGLNESDIPFNILIEEKNWLRQKMGIEVIKAQVQINHFYELLKFFFETAKTKVPAFASLPIFKDIFKSGKSTTAINKDLRNLLNQLYSSDKPLMNEFLAKLENVVNEIQTFLKPYTGYQEIENTIIEFKTKP